jgi:hypothetical protein
VRGSLGPDETFGFIVTVSREKVVKADDGERSFFVAR